MRDTRTMLVQHGAVEMLLRCRFARCFEMHFAELLVVRLSQSRLAKGKSNHRCGSNREWRSHLLSFPSLKNV